MELKVHKVFKVKQALKVLMEPKVQQVLKVPLEPKVLMEPKERRAYKVSRVLILLGLHLHTLQLIIRQPLVVLTIIVILWHIL